MKVNIKKIENGVWELWVNGKFYKTSKTRKYFINLLQDTIGLNPTQEYNLMRGALVELTKEPVTNNWEQISFFQGIQKL